jgi:hypothetical protein
VTADAWDTAKARAGLAHRDRDVKRLRALLERWNELTEWEGNAFGDMLDALTADPRELTTAQRESVEKAADRLGLEIEYEDLISSGKAPRGREVESMIKDHPLKPPGRQ